MAYVSFHEIASIRARSTETAGAPLILSLSDGDLPSDEIIIFLGDQRLTDRMIAAINRTMDEWRDERAAETRAAEEVISTMRRCALEP